MVGTVMVTIMIVSELSLSLNPTDNTVRKCSFSLNHYGNKMLMTTHIAMTHSINVVTS